MKAKIPVLLAGALLSALPVWAKDYKLTSPDGNITANVSVNDSICYSVMRQGNQIILPSRIALKLSGGKTLGAKSSVASVNRVSVDKTFNTPVFKRSCVRDHCNEMTLKMRGGYSVVFRCYDDGVAYRFLTSMKDSLTVENEIAQFNFPIDGKAFAAYTNTTDEGGFESQFFNSFENTYDVKPLTQLNSRHLMILPFMAESEGGNKVCISESDLMDYPGMFLNNSAATPSVNAVFAPVVKSQSLGGHAGLQMMVSDRYGYIARTAGKRSFPWRLMVISDKDQDFAVNDMVYRLASPSRIADPSWIRPGKVAWDWWNDWNICGVDFRAGINTPTYKYYIDFACANNIEYVILDEGWAVDGKLDLFQVVPELDIKEIIDYGKQKNVGIILWAGYWPYRKDMHKVTEYYSKLGAKGFKIDFMDRDDQDIMQFLEQTAELCAEHKMLVDFHGTCKPAGLQRTWPNVINYEGVNGLEQLKWKEVGYDQVTYDLQIPFIRMLAGPMDYTQGAMRNVKRENYYPCFTQPMSQGTRCRQLASYVIFESPLNMLCDAPSNYMKESECTAFIASVPEVWDESVGLDSHISEYAAIARKKGDEWYVGAMTNWDAREMTIDLSFLGQGNFKAEVFADGVNADRNACDYAHNEMIVPSDRKLTVKMMPGGGWVARIYRY